MVRTYTCTITRTFTHHYLSAVGSIIMLSWPNGAAYQQYYIQLLWCVKVIFLDIVVVVVVVLLLVVLLLVVVVVLVVVGLIGRWWVVGLCGWVGVVRVVPSFRLGKRGLTTDSWSGPPQYGHYWNNSLTMG